MCAQAAVAQWYMLKNASHTMLHIIYLSSTSDIFLASDSASLRRGRIESEKLAGFLEAP